MKKTINVKYRTLKLISLLLLASFTVVFAIGWLKSLVAVAVTAALLVAVFFSAKDKDDRQFPIRLSTLLSIVIIVAVWAWLSGVGGFYTQKSDHEMRNVIFRDLIYYKWPVRYSVGNDESLVYYIGFWMLPALIGKAANAVSGEAAAWLAGRIALYLLSVITVVLAFLVTLVFLGYERRKYVYFSLAIFILFSGMDVIGCLMHSLKLPEHLEWWASLFQYSSMTTQLFWVFNQALPAWLATALFLNEKNEKNYALIGLLILSTSPLPLVGLAVLMLAYALRSFVKSIKKGNAKDFILNVFSPQNILSVIFVLPVYALYYTNNTASVSAAAAPTQNAYSDTSDPFYWIVLVLFILFEFFTLTALLYTKKHRFEFGMLTLSLMVIPLFRVGYSIDFCMRASIPALFVLMTFLMKYLPASRDAMKPLKKKSKKDYQQALTKFVLVLTVFLIGTATPITEVVSSTAHFINSNGASASELDTYKSLTELPITTKGNFIGENSTDSYFYKYIGKTE